MIGLHLSDLDSSNIYAKTLQAIEAVCEGYALEKEFAVLSMANQQMVDMFLQSKMPFTVQVDIRIDNMGVEIAYESSSEVLDIVEREESDKIMDILSILVDEFDYNTENKTITLGFHMKPKFSIHREMEKSVLARQNIIKQL